MGYRHQIFIISMVNSRYRILAAVHNQCLYGASPTRACWRILQILQHPANQKLIKYELHHAVTRPDERWDGLEQDQYGFDDPVQFPFITTCPVLGVGPDVRQILFITVDFRDVDNDDGLTMIDISNLVWIRYCFVELDGMTPLTGEQYYRTYYPEYRSSDPISADLGTWGLIKGDALRNLWPDGKWEEADVFDSIDVDVPAKNSSRSLMSLTFEQLIEQALDNPEEGKKLTVVEQLPSIHSHIVYAQKPGTVGVGSVPEA